MPYKQLLKEFQDKQMDPQIIALLATYTAFDRTRDRSLTLREAKEILNLKDTVDGKLGLLDWLVSRKFLTEEKAEQLKYMLDLI